jgi:hypothetical protein
LGYRFNAELIVENKGKEVIRSFSVYSDLVGGINCLQNYYYQKFTGLNILPGETKKVITNQMLQMQLNKLELCFQCMAPNSELEIDLTNNSLCKNILLNNLAQKSKARFKVYPNPTQDLLFIENTELKLKSIEIYDANGKNLYSQICNEELVQINTAQLRKGAYLLKLIQYDSSENQLLIK